MAEPLRLLAAAVAVLLRQGQQALVAILAVQVGQVLHLLRLGHQLPVAVAVAVAVIKVVAQEVREAVALAQMMRLVRLLRAP
jgi:hypothetical protein